MIDSSTNLNMSNSQEADEHNRPEKVGLWMDVLIASKQRESRMDFAVQRFTNDHS